MIDFQLFIEKNDLLKKDIASFLGVSNAFITQLCDGSKKIPAQKLALIKANTQGWDISMFEAENAKHVEVQGRAGVIVNGNNSYSPIDNRQYYSDSPDVLRAQIDLLDARIQEKEERLKEKDAQIKEKDAQIKEKDAQIKEKDAQIKQLLDILQGK